MKANPYILCVIIGLFNVFICELTYAITQDIVAFSTDIPELKFRKDKLQIKSKDITLYHNHRSDTETNDPENAQETIFEGKPNQFIIRPIAPHQHQQHESHQEPQLRNYGASYRPHAANLLEQNQEVQHYVYLQDIMRNQPKALTPKAQERTQVSSLERNNSAIHKFEVKSAEEEAEQNYAVTVSTQQRKSESVAPYHQSQQQSAHSYQDIPEQHFLKFLEDELQLRSLYAAQQRQLQPHLIKTDATHKIAQHTQSDISSNYRNPLLVQKPAPQRFLQNIQRNNGGKFNTHRQLLDNVIENHQHHLEPQLPPQIAYYQPKISYKALPNHPLAKSSLESEIEKLLEANKPSSVGYANNHQLKLHTIPFAMVRPSASPSVQPSLQQLKDNVDKATPNALLDANNQPFLPTIFKFTNIQSPTSTYPTEKTNPVNEGRKMGSPAYLSSTQDLTVQSVPQNSYNDAEPSGKPEKAYQSKLIFSNKSFKKSDFIHSQDQQLPLGNFKPSPPSPLIDSIQPTQPHSIPELQKLAQYPVQQYPKATPSQSSIYVSQGTGIVSPIVFRTKTTDDVKKLQLPLPGGKPLTQAEFQTLVDAGYPVTAVPVPVPVPYEQYVKDHPEYRNHPPVNLAHHMRFSRGQFTDHHPYTLPSEPSLKIISAQSDSAVSGDRIAYLQVSPNQHRRPRDDKETVNSKTENGS